VITTLEGRVQIGCGDINAKFDDFTTRIEKEERHVLGMMPTLSLNQFMQILVVSITTGIHLMKKIYFR